MPLFSTLNILFIEKSQITRILHLIMKLSENRTFYAQIFSINAVLTWANSSKSCRMWKKLFPFSREDFQFYVFGKLRQLFYSCWVTARCLHGSFAGSRVFYVSFKFPYVIIYRLKLIHYNYNPIYWCNKSDFFKACF